jgi:biopolymer transport protein TolR
MLRNFTLVLLSLLSLLTVCLLAIPKTPSVGFYVSLPFIAPRNDAASTYVTSSMNLFVRVDSRHNWWLNRSQLSEPDLRRVLRERLNARAEREVFFIADTDLSYGEVMHALDAINDTRDTKVVLVTAPLQMNSDDFIWSEHRTRNDGPLRPNTLYIP